MSHYIVECSLADCPAAAVRGHSINDRALHSFEEDIVGDTDHYALRSVTCQHVCAHMQAVK